MQEEKVMSLISLIKSNELSYFYLKFSFLNIFLARWKIRQENEKDWRI